MIDDYDDAATSEDDAFASLDDRDEAGNGQAETESLPPARVSDDPAGELQALVAFVAAHLVDRPEDVEVRVTQHGQNVQLSLVVPEDELGKVIGRQGRIARAIRTVVMVAGSRHNLRASLDIEG